MQLRTGRGRRIVLGLLVVVGALAAWAALARPASDPDRIWQEAEADFRAGRHDQAEAALARLARLRAPTTLDWMLRAQVAMVRDRTDDALAALAKVPDGDSMAPQARLLAGQLELRRYRMRPAESWLRAALTLDPKLVQAHRELVYIYGLQSRREELGAEFRALSDLTPLTIDNVFHWCLTRNSTWEPAELSNILTRFIRADPDDRWSRLALADCQRRLGRLDDAEQLLSALPATDPDARALRVRLALDRGDDRAAEALLAEGPPDHPELARLRGRRALSRHEGPEALRHFRAAYAAQPDNRDTLFGLASALTMVGDDVASAPFLKASRDHDRLGSLMQQVSVERRRDDPKLLRQLGAACEAIHRLREARAWYTLAIRRDPLDAEAQQALFRLDAAIKAESPVAGETSTPPSPTGKESG